MQLQEGVETDGVEWRQRGEWRQTVESAVREWRQVNDVTPPASPFSDKFSGNMEKGGRKGEGKGAGRGREEREEHGKMGRWE